MPVTRLDDRFQWANLRFPALMMAIFWAIAVILWQSTGVVFYLYNFAYIGAAIGLGIGLYSALPRRRKHWGRRVAQFLVGSYMLVYLGLVAGENMQIEGFFFYLFAGFFAGSVIHYLVAKVVGPALFNRGWCGWACWTAMILDLLPYPRNKQGRLPNRWGYLRYIHLGASLCLALFVWFGLGQRIGSPGMDERIWLIVGNVLYYGIGIPLAFILRDNRAFCKYICPIPTLQKVSSRFALLKIAGDAAKCVDCGACVRACPMDINISAYIKKGQRVLSTECILCLDCVNACAHGALDSSFSWDIGGRERLRQRDQSS